MNVIQAPALIIKVWLKEFTNEDRRERYLQKTREKLDFYKMGEYLQSDNFNPEKIEKNDKSFNRNNLKEKNYEKRKSYFISLFENDKRIINCQVINETAYLKFKNVNQSLDFYKHHFEVLKMEFCMFSDLEEMLMYSDKSVIAKEAKIIEETGGVNQTYLTTPPKSLSTVENKNKIPDEEEDDGFKEKIIDITCDSSSIISSTRNEFLDRVEYFNNLKYVYSKSEVSKMTDINQKHEKSWLLLNTKELFVGVHSNVAVQEEIKKMDEQDIYIVITNIGTDISPIASTKYGAYSTQTLLTSAKLKGNVSKLSQNLQYWGKYLITDYVGNYTIQRFIASDSEMVFKLFMEDLNYILTDNLGMKVLMKCLNFFYSKKSEIFKRLKELKCPKNSKSCTLIETYFNKATTN